MWFLIALIFINAVADRAILFDYRLSVGGLPISILDILTGLALAVAIMWCGDETPQPTHPLLKIVAWLFFASAVFGVIGGMTNGSIPRWVITPTRDLLTLPLVAFVSYRLVGTERRIHRLLYTVIWASIGSAVVSLLFVSHATQDIAAGGSFDELRSTAIGGDVGVAAAAVLLFGMFAGIQVFRRWIAFPLLVIAVLGAFSLPHRSSWLVAIVTCLYAAFLLHRRDFFRKAVMSTLVVVVLTIVGSVAIAAVSRQTGRDYGRYIEERLSSFMPGNVSRKENHPWETRLPGILRELELWLGNPIMGRGFGIQTVDSIRHPEIPGYRHNVWTSALVEGGPCELAAMVFVVFGMIVIGYRMVRDRGDRVFVLMGALGSSMGIWAFIAATSSMTLNLQGPAIIVGSIFGGMLRARALQLARAQESAESADLTHFDEDNDTSEAIPTQEVFY